MLNKKLGNIEVFRHKFEKLKILNGKIAMHGIHGEPSAVLKIRRDEITIEIEKLVETIPDEELLKLHFK